MSHYLGNRLPSQLIVTTNVTKSIHGANLHCMCIVTKTFGHNIIFTPSMNNDCLEQNDCCLRLANDKTNTYWSNPSLLSSSQPAAARTPDRQYTTKLSTSFGGFGAPYFCSNSSSGRLKASVSSPTVAWYTHCVREVVADIKRTSIRRC